MGDTGLCGQRNKLHGNTGRTIYMGGKMKLLNVVRKRFKEIVQKNGLMEESIEVEARGLSPEESIGDPGRDDFPLMTGREVMIQACFKNSYGQAFTDHPGNFKDSLQEVINLSLRDNYKRALFIATLNAVLRELKLAEKTIHCRDDEPRLCSNKVVAWIEDNIPAAGKIGIIGYQPAMVEQCCSYFGPDNVIVSDLNKERLGENKYGVIIGDGGKENDRLIREADFVLMTGSSLVNDTIDNLLQIVNKYNRDYCFFGNTISGTVSLLDLPHLCFYGH